MLLKGIGVGLPVKKSVHPFLTDLYVSKPLEPLKKKGKGLSLCLSPTISLKSFGIKTRSRSRSRSV